MLLKALPVGSQPKAFPTLQKRPTEGIWVWILKILQTANQIKLSFLNNNSTLVRLPSSRKLLETKLTNERMQHIVTSIGIRKGIFGINNAQFGTIFKWMFPVAQIKEHTAKSLKQPNRWFDEIHRLFGYFTSIRPVKCLEVYSPKHLGLDPPGNSNTYRAAPGLCTSVSCAGLAENDFFV